jgi:CheY-like chemotaxis protein
MDPGFEFAFEPLAFEVLEKNRDVELVLMDMMLPEIGYEATRKLREKHFDLPIIALTAKAMMGEREKTLGAGCNDFVPKPVEHDRLIALLRKWLKLEGHRERTER